ncbi:hypothetical protein [Prevotella sp. P6B1]|uniref:hypothetical protein n=1 Tax=Prevotella sp. P6B1 TaxID=1410613 RepID=UPI00051AB83D|nr:hypothetical protein [Prevotella sp. P6B1]
MKKNLLILMMLVGALTAQAKDYTYLTFETTDGAKASVDVSSLPVTINLDSSTLTIGSQSFSLANLSKMYFSTSDETSATGISEVMKADLDEATEIYDLQGHKVSKNQMRRGVFVIKTKQRTFKLNVK